MNDWDHQENPAPDDRRRGALVWLVRAVVGLVRFVLRWLFRAVGGVFRLLRALVVRSFPTGSLARDPKFKFVVSSRLLSDVGQQSLLYGALVVSVRNGGTALDAASIGVASMLPSATIGIYLGSISDVVPKRLALFVGYGLQAATCFAVPQFLGSGQVDLLVLILLVNAFAQISSPAESSLVPLVVAPERIGQGASLIPLAAAAGSAIGTAMVAPVVVKLFGVQELVYTAGVVLAGASLLVIGIGRLPKGTRVVAASSAIGLRSALAWMIDHPAVATMLALAVIGATSNTILQTLAPRYVSEALGVDAADAVYVFAPSTAGMLAGLASCPLLMRLTTLRATAFIGTASVALSIACLGLVGPAGSVIDTFNPLALLGRIGLDIPQGLRTAALLSAPIAFGVTLAGISAHTFINRNVTGDIQGRAFALLSTLKNALAIVSLLTLGGIATLTQIEIVLGVMPVAIILLAAGIGFLSFRYTGREVPHRADLMRTFWAPSIQEAAADDSRNDG